MKRRSLLATILGIAVLALAVVWFWFNGLNFNLKRAETNANSTSLNTNTQVQLPSLVSYPGEDGQSALELLKAKHEVVETDGFVKAIDGRASSTTSYWLYYVNGNAAEVGAKDYVTKSTDTIEWRFESAK